LLIALCVGYHPYLKGIDITDLRWFDCWFFVEAIRHRNFPQAIYAGTAKVKVGAFH
jgi:hypothetical protein